MYATMADGRTTKAITTTGVLQATKKLQFASMLYFMLVLRFSHGTTTLLRLRNVNFFCSLPYIFYLLYRATVRSIRYFNGQKIGLLFLPNDL